MKILTLDQDILTRVVLATVVSKKEGRDYFFSRNGKPSPVIHCHLKQGGSLEVSSQGYILHKQNYSYEPVINMPLVLFRRSADPKCRDYTDALRWAPAEDWHEVCWAVNAHETFRVVGRDHRVNGRVQTNSLKEVELAKGTLLKIMKINPRGVNNDPLGTRHFTRLGGDILSYGQVIWYHLDLDGKWTEYDDPRPAHTVNLANV